VSIRAGDYTAEGDITVSGFGIGQLQFYGVSSNPTGAILKRLIISNCFRVFVAYLNFPQYQSQNYMYISYTFHTSIQNCYFGSSDLTTNSGTAVQCERDGLVVFEGTGGTITNVYMGVVATSTKVVITGTITLVATSGNGSNVFWALYGSTFFVENMPSYSGYSIPFSQSGTGKYIWPIGKRVPDTLLAMLKIVYPVYTIYTYVGTDLTKGPVDWFGLLSEPGDWTWEEIYDEVTYARFPDSSIPEGQIGGQVGSNSITLVPENLPTNIPGSLMIDGVAPLNWSANAVYASGSAVWGYQVGSSVDGRTSYQVTNGGVPINNKQLALVVRKFKRTS